MGTDTPEHGSSAGVAAPGRHVGFPPGSSFVLLPRRPARAARAGLALYEAVEPRQHFAARVGDTLSRAGLAGLLPTRDRSEVDGRWWEAFIATVVEPLVGPVASCAFRVPGNPRVSALALDAAGMPLAFAKLLNTVAPQLPAEVSEILSSADTQSFRAPRTLAEGSFDGWIYRVLEPLPEGLHHAPGYDPNRVARIVDEFHKRLDGVGRPVGVPPSYVLCHADLTPRNLRVASDGSWWLFDWDNVRWGPKLSDELRYWCAWFAYRRKPDVARDAGNVLRLLLARGSAQDVREAVAWPDRVAQTYRAIEGAMLRTVGEMAQ